MRHHLFSSDDNCRDTYTLGARNIPQYNYSGCILAEPGQDWDWTVDHKIFVFNLPD